MSWSRGVLKRVVERHVDFELRFWVNNSAWVFERKSWIFDQEIGK